MICIGNEARGDDGVACEVARRLDGLPALRVLSAPQLDVAMAAEIASANRVTFVDAERRGAPPVERREVLPAPFLAGPTTHTLDPAGLLALAEALYGRAPAAEILTLAAPEMEHAEGLSPVAALAAAMAEAMLPRGAGRLEEG
ncbi:MAG: hydrogenase maturation protease [Coriobacteriia bacterium]|nr:hydrogenase maturation protease [Coriobacteriia bacterium]